MLSDYGYGLQDFGSFPDGDAPCPSCGSDKCVNFACEDEEGDVALALLEHEGKTYYCTVCRVNAVDALHGEDTCWECLRKQ